MAEKLKYQYYDEGNYVSPAEINDEALSRIKNRRVGITVLDVLKNRY